MIKKNAANETKDGKDRPRALRSAVVAAQFWIKRRDEMQQRDEGSRGEREEE